jgi:ribose-phosphate pyrophosphokinase
MGAVELLVHEGAREVYTTTVHPILSGPAVSRLRQLPIRKLVVTDSVPLDAKRPALENLEVLTVSMLLGEAISRIHTGESVGALFGATV